MNQEEMVEEQILKDGFPDSDFEKLTRRIEKAGDVVSSEEWKSLKKEFNDFWADVLENSGSKPKKEKFLKFFTRTVETCDHRWKELFYLDGGRYHGKDAESKNVPWKLVKEVEYGHGSVREWHDVFDMECIRKKIRRPSCSCKYESLYVCVRCNRYRVRISFVDVEDMV